MYQLGAVMYSETGPQRGIPICLGVSGESHSGAEFEQGWASQKVQIDVRLDDVVLRTLEKEPERRYQQVGEVKSNVETISRSKPNSKRKLSMKQLIILIGIIAVLGAALVYEVAQNHQLSQSLKPFLAQKAQENRQEAHRSTHKAEGGLLR